MTKLILIGSILAFSFPVFAEKNTDGPENTTVAKNCAADIIPLKCYIDTGQMQPTTPLTPGFSFKHGIFDIRANELTNGDLNKFLDPEAVKNNTLNQSDGMKTGKQ